MEKEWLQTRITVDEAERKNLETNLTLGFVSVPFGSQNSEWLQLKNKMQETDELWEFKSPPATWSFLCGRAGICIVRKGEIISSIVTEMN